MHLWVCADCGERLFEMDEEEYLLSDDEQVEGGCPQCDGVDIEHIEE